jgi:hypothetical protein
MKSRVEFDRVEEFEGEPVNKKEKDLEGGRWGYFSRISVAWRKKGATRERPVKRWGKRIEKFMEIRPPRDLP